MLVTLQAAGGEPDPARGCLGISEMARDLLSGLLNVNEDSRMSVRDALRHSWFKAV